MPAEQRRAVAYLRVSLEEQAERGVSLDAQRARVVAHAAAAGLHLVEVVEDRGASGKSLERPGLQRALAMLGGAADSLLIVTLDRLTRSIRDWGELLETYFSGKATLVSVGEHVDVQTASGRFVLNILFAKAQFEREQTAERTSVAVRHKAAQGEYIGGDAPYGQRLTSEGRLERHPDEQAAIALARAARDRGLSLRAIAGELGQAGHRSRSRKPFAAAQVARMLAAPESRPEAGTDAVESKPPEG